jgi:RNA polymerase sigma-70 factor (ECF subfamily)
MVALGLLALPSIYRVTNDPLVRRCAAGDLLAWQQLHRQYHSVVRAFLRRLGIRDRDVDDACQEVFVRLHRSLGSFRGESELKTWIYRVCVTEAGRLRRRLQAWEALRSVVAKDAEEPSVPGPEPSDFMLRQRVEAALGRMSAGDRAAFVLYELEGLSGKEVADVLGCPVATVWRRLHYARRTFGEEFGVEGNG